METVAVAVAPASARCDDDVAAARKRVYIKGGSKRASAAEAPEHSADDVAAAERETLVLHFDGSVMWSALLRTWGIRIRGTCTSMAWTRAAARTTLVHNVASVSTQCALYACIWVWQDHCRVLREWMLLQRPLPPCQPASLPPYPPP
jgi:hypothetical protein